jgi:hypothetical protein
MTPFAEIADAFNAIGIAQDLQSSSNRFIGDRQGALMAAQHRFNETIAVFCHIGFNNEKMMSSRSASVTDGGKRT